MKRPVQWLASVLLAASVPAAATTSTTVPPAFVIHRVDTAAFDDRPGQPVFALLVGNDGRPGLDGERGDALHVVGVNPGAGRATLLNIPRDTYVDIPGRGRDKITMAYLLGGPQLQARAVANLTGAPISFVVSTNLAGFRALVDDLGGVDVDVPFAMHDRNSGANFPQGRVHMDGAAALAFSRNRYIPDGDVRRTEHQAIVLLSLLTKLRAQGHGPSGTLRLVGVALRHVSVEGAGGRDLYRLARLALTTDPAGIRTMTMPSRLGKVGASDVVFPAPIAHRLFLDFKDDAVLQAH